MKIDKQDNQITVKGSPIFIGIGFICLFMACTGVYLLSQLLPLEKNYKASDIIGVVIVIIFLLVVCYCGFFAIFANSKRIIINNKGIEQKRILKSKVLLWSKIKDFGLSYCGQTRFEGNTYYLYFSDTVLVTKNDCSKILKRKTIKTLIIGDDYYKTASDIIPYCQKKTNAECFVGKDKYHNS